MEFVSSKAKALRAALIFLLGAVSLHAADAVFTRVAAPFVGVRGGAMAWGDYDNDGYLDVIVIGDASGSNGHGSTILYHNNGDGTFSRAPFSFAGFRSGSVAWGDFDNDGYVDLLISGLGTDALTRIYRNQGGTNFVEAKRFGIDIDGKVSWGDFNNDGKLDFAMCGAGAYNQIYQNLGNTNFVLLNTGMNQLYYGSVGWADYNRDGNLDLLLTGVNNIGALDGAYVYRNDGTGHFTNVFFLQFADDPGRWLDTDNDGWPDLALSRYSRGATYLYRNNQAGGFTQAALLPYGPLVTGDFNNDGWTDLLINNQVMQNSSNGAWVSVSTSLPDLGSSTLVNNAFCGDFDNDGRLDLILSDSGYTVYLYRNITAATNTPPSAPPGLRAAASRTNVLLSWNGATDQNQASGLTYNLRVGTSPGGCDVISPMSAPNGFRRVVREGNAGSMTQHTLVGLSAGKTYYWSVQAVDNSFAGSPFAPEKSFVATVLPTLSTFSNQTVFQDSGPLVLPFTVSDVETPADLLVVTAVSSNPQLVGSSNLVVSGTSTNRTLVITPQPGQTGTATITVTVTDGDGGQTAQQFQLVVLPANHPPVAVIIVSPLIDLPGLSNLTVMTPLCHDATLVLDASRSSDLDGDALQFVWTANANTPLGNEMIVTNQFAPGSWTITLSVSDGKTNSTAVTNVEVITPAQAVAAIASFLQKSGLAHGQQQPALASLEAAEASFDRCHLTPAINQLQAFQSKVHSTIEAQDAVLAQALVQGAEQVIQALTVCADCPTGSDGFHRRQVQLTRGESGKVRIEFAGTAGKSYIIEASTNLLNWDRIGTATPRGDGTFEFDDSQGTSGTRYFRIVTP